MSVDYYLVSPSKKRGAQVGSIGLGGVQSYPGVQEVVDFIRWAIAEHVTDIKLVPEDTYYNFVDPDDKGSLTALHVGRRL